MKKYIKLVALLAVLAGSITVFTGCQTAEGFGEDVEKAGDTIQKSVD